MATHSKGDNVGKSISLDVELFQFANERWQKLKLPSFSAYVQKLVREDLESRGELVFKEDSKSPRKRRKK